MSITEQILNELDAIDKQLLLHILMDGDRKWSPTFSFFPQFKPIRVFFEKKHFWSTEKISDAGADVLIKMLLLEGTHTVLKKHKAFEVLNDS
jgi:hypothetical protein